MLIVALIIAVVFCAGINLVCAYWAVKDRVCQERVVIVAHDEAGGLVTVGEYVLPLEERHD